MGNSRSWVDEHKVCWEIGPAREFVIGHGLRQTGYELTLFGRFDPAAQDDDHAAAHRVYDGLHALALELLRSLPEPHVFISVLPFDQGVHFRRESHFANEIGLTLVGSPAEMDQPVPAAEARRRVKEVEDKLRSMGVHQKTWEEADA